MNVKNLPRNDLQIFATKPNAKIFSEFLKMIVAGANLRLVVLFNTRLLFRDSYSYSNTPLGFWASTPFHSISAYALTINKTPVTSSKQLHIDLQLPALPRFPRFRALYYTSKRLEL
jgi:hypothetical protein